MPSTHDTPKNVGLVIPTWLPVINFEPIPASDETPDTEPQPDAA